MYEILFNKLNFTNNSSVFQNLLTENLSTYFLLHEWCVFECYFIIKTISRWFQLNTIFIRSFILLQVFCNFSDFFTKIFWALDCSTDYLLRIENAYYSICKLHSVAQETRSYLFLLQYHNKYFAMHLFYTNEPVAIVSIIAYKTVVSRI